MKKLIYCALALAAGLFAASCQQENLEPVQGGTTVTFTVEIPEVATKADAVGDDANMINDLVYAVYVTEAESLEKAQEDWDGTKTKLLYAFNSESKRFENGTDVISLELLNNQNHIVLLWAQNADTWVKEKESVDIDLRNITYPSDMKLNPEKADNADKYAAFYAVKFIPSTERVNNGKIELTRPFAQINIATANPGKYDVNVEKTVVTVKGAGDAFDVAKEQAADNADVTYEWTGKVYTDKFTVAGNDYDHYIAMNYVFANDAVEVSYTIDTDYGKGINNTISNVPVKKNYRTNIVGNLLTSNVSYDIVLDKDWEAEYNVSPEGDVVKNTYVESASEIQEIINELNNTEVQSAIITLNGDINLNDLITTRSEGSEASKDPSVTITNGNSLILDLNGKKLSATSLQTGKNYNMFDVRGNLTVKNGTIEYQHNGDNMGWNASTNIFNVTAGGVLNLDGVTAKNLGGSDMGFVAHLNNWGEVTLNAENCTLESNYVPVRVFNSGYDMNNVTIKNSTLKGGSAAFWVHNYTVEDFGTEEKAESQKALLNFSIYNQENTFSPDINGIRYGFTNSVRTDAYGITKTVSEDGTKVTLGTLVENGLVRRGVAGAEENTTITKAIVGEGITTLYDRTFRRFYALETVVLPNTLTTIGAAGSGVFQSCTALKNIVIPESVTVLGKGTFQECSSLESINIPAGVTRIEENALRATGLVSVEFHESVTYFGAQAFRDCKQLKEVVIKAPEFEMEGNTFGITAAPFTQMTIYVANPAMKAYVESKLTDHAKTYITVVGPEEVSDTEDLNTALADGKDVFLTADIAVANTEVGSNGYGATGISQLKGGTIDGNGKSISVNAWGTWDSAINTTGGTIKNVNVTGGMRGIFINHNSEYSEKVILQNVTIDGTIYTISCDQGTNKGLEAYNSTFKGWTSYAATIGTVKFDNCSFGEGQGYAFCRPYAATEFVNCAFETGFELDACAPVTFENCTLDGVALTAENLSTLVTENTTNATVK